MTVFKLIFALGAAAMLSACATTGAGPVKALPPGFLNVVMEAAFAETIAEECRSLRYNQARETKILGDQAVQLAASGYTGRDLDYAAERMERDPKMTEKALQMIVDRKINVASEASWCAAGKREKARRTNIGQYLI